MCETLCRAKRMKKPVGSSKNDVTDLRGGDKGFCDDINKPYVQLGEKNVTLFWVP